MKKTITLLAFALLTLASSSQVVISLLLGDKLNSPDLEFGLEGGINFTNLSNLETGSSLANLNLGFYFDIRMKNQLYFYTGVQVKSSFGSKNLSGEDLVFLGADDYDWEGTYTQKFNTFMVPLLLNYKFKNHFYIEGGPQLGLTYDSWLEFNSDKNGKEVKIKDYNKDMINKISGGLASGFGYKLQQGTGMTIGVRYYQGLSNDFKGISGSRHNSLHFKVNIPIGAGKAKAKEEAKKTPTR